MSRLRLRRPSGWRKAGGVSTVEGVEESRRRRRTYGGLREARIAAATGDGHRGPSRRKTRAIRCRERGQSSGGTLWERWQLCRAWPELFRTGRSRARCHIISNQIPVSSDALSLIRRDLPPRTAQCPAQRCASPRPSPPCWMHPSLPAALATLEQHTRARSLIDFSPCDAGPTFPRPPENLRRGEHSLGRLVHTSASPPRANVLASQSQVLVTHTRLSRLSRADPFELSYAALSLHYLILCSSAPSHCAYAR